MQLLKWLFAILVVLNIVVFANVVTQKMNGKRPQHNPAVVAVPIGTGDGGELVESAPSQVGASTGHRVVPAAPLRREQGNALNTAPANVANMPKSVPNCTAQITLPEDAYHRLKNFIGGWSNSANRNVVANKSGKQAQSVQYQVLVANASDEVLQQLREAGINASLQGNSISLGQFANADQANAVRSRAMAAGVGGVIVSERGGAQSALTSANYTVTFHDIDNQSAQKINAVLGRYGRLQRSACAK